MLMVFGFVAGCDCGGDGGRDTKDDDPPGEREDDDESDYTTQNRCNEVVYDALVEKFFWIDVDGYALNEEQLREWCELCADFTDLPLSPFWECSDDCVKADYWFEPCLECLVPNDPEPGCNRAVQELYNCDVVLIFADTKYFVPTLDINPTCETVLPDWTCFADCIDQECDYLHDFAKALACLNADCDTTGLHLISLPTENSRFVIAG